jgi:hypothetical protein
MRRFSVWLMAVSSGIILSLSGWAKQPAVTQDQLVRNTQELFDAVGAGDQAPFKKYFAEDVIFADEKGRTMDKAALIKDIAPFPPGFSGTIKIVSPQSRIVGDTAILSYDLDETETIYGQKLNARYHEIDTWMHRDGKWQIIATQVHRYYEDPAPGKADVNKFADYAGTYELAPGMTMTVSAEGDHLFSQRGTRAKEELIPEASDIFFRKGVEGRRLFHYGADGKVDALIDRRNNQDVVWKKTK